MNPAASQGIARQWFDHDVTRCQRKILAIAPTFEIFDAQGAPLVYCQEKLFKIKDDIRVYADGSKQHELLRIKQRNVLDWAGVFDVFAPGSEQKLGAFRRKGWRSFLRDEWHILDEADNQVGVLVETGPALLRRFLKFLPYSFAFTLGQQTLGTFTQHFSFIRYVATMELSPWRNAPLDRRMAYAGALLLMAVEAKEDRDNS